MGSIILIIVFISLAACILYFVRNNLSLPRDSLASSFTDTFVTFVGGGSLRTNHRFEKLFFTIVLVGAIFMGSLWSGDIFDYIFRVQQYEVSTFDQLAEINAPIHLSKSLTKDSKNIEQLLR